MIFDKIKEFLVDFYHSFAVQLLLLQFKKHQLLLLMWIMVFSFVGGSFGAEFGLRSLLLDPEYLSKSGYLSYTLTGIGFATFFVSWNLTCYILHSHRFPFLASFQSPMGVFFINNSVIPFVFVVFYLSSIVTFQNQDQFADKTELVLDIVGFIGGSILVLLLTATYFQITNKDALRLKQDLDNERSNSFLSKRREHYNEVDLDSPIQVDYFLSTKLQIRHTRNIDHYSHLMHHIVFKRHHFNSLFTQLVVFLVLMGLGFLMENDLFQLPTACNVFFFLSIMAAIFGSIIYWSGNWGNIAIVAILLLINQLTKLDFLGYQSRAYGLNYQTEKEKYSISALQKLSSTQNIQRDVNHFELILNNWLKKNKTPSSVHKKPKIVFINTSGGGLRAAMFSTAVMQQADSLLHGTLFDKTFLITGASGGMFSNVYIRELFLQAKLTGKNAIDKTAIQNISKDLLNPMCASILSNDMFFPIHKFQLDSMLYFKDRGYMMEKQLEINTQGLFSKRIADYQEDEFKAKIPLLIFHTNIINDSRRYYISSQPVSFLMRPVGKYSTNKNLVPDAVDFCAFFKKQKGDRLKIASAARMNATFPFILPNSVLPSDPPTYVMDGGTLDNFGSETTYRVVQTFKDWIKKNTSGVVILQIRDTEKYEEIEKIEKKSVFQTLADPLGTIFSNMEKTQDFDIDQKLGLLNDELDGQVQMITFEYIPEKKEEKAPLCLHLTEREKRNILTSLSRPNNAHAFQLMMQEIK